MILLLLINMPNLNQAYSWAINTCNAPNVGYSQTYRNQQTINGITYYDCSSFIWYALLAGGFDCVTANNGNSWPFTTSTMPTILPKLGFTEVNASGPWLPGDVALGPGHTEMVYEEGVSQGVCMGAHTSNLPLADQVSINPWPSTTANFNRIFRYGDGGATGYGFSIYVVAALCGNSWRESYINPGQGEIGGGGFGLFQWTGGRRTNLENWLADNGYDNDSPEGQLLYLIEENDWIQNYGPYETLEDFLNSDSTDLDELVACFMYNWERPAVPALDERIEYAYQCFDYIQEHANDTEITQWIISPNPITPDETLNNAVMMYRFYSAGGGGGGTPGKLKKKMPVWMWIRYRNLGGIY